MERWYSFYVKTEKGVALQKNLKKTYLYGLVKVFVRNIDYEDMV